MALGSLLIQKQLGFSDRELVEEITENPYFQYFIGLPGYQMEAPFVPSLLVEFRKRLTDDILGEINEMIIAYNMLYNIFISRYKQHEFMLIFIQNNNVENLVCC